MEGEPNILSTLVFFLWVPASLWAMRRWPPAKGTAIVFLTGLLFLPELITFRIPGLPPFSKNDILVLWLMVGIVAFHRDRLRSVAFTWHFKLCVALILIGGAITVFLNMDPLRYGSSHIPAHVPYDVVHFTIDSSLKRIIPFVIGFVMFHGASDLRTLLQVYVIAALGYSLFQFGEMALSPQFHHWLYGFHQHSFVQTVRGGGFRPMVFMAHGLALAIFTSMAVTASAALFKVKAKARRVNFGWAAGYLWVLLATSRSAAALLYSFVSVPLVLFTSPRKQVAVATVFAAILLVYPLARAADLIPIEEINELVLENYGEERVGSLRVRFDNEVQILSKAQERLIFGWGRYCRACIYDPWSGELLSVRDGAWITALGDDGVVGFMGQFGLMVFPIFFLLPRIRLVPGLANRRLLAALSLMVGVSCFDLVPNGVFNPLAIVLSGALSGSMTGIFREASLARRRRRIARLEASRQAEPVPTPS